MTAIAFKTWKRGDERALHKPLLFLLALVRIQQGKPRIGRYAELGPALGDLLAKYGNRSSKVSPEYPFWRLQSDGIWVVQSASPITPSASGDVSNSTLMKAAASGGFTEDAYARYTAQPDEVRRDIITVLNDYFEPGLHPDLIADLGIDLAADGESDNSTAPRTRRDPAFVDEVLRAYEYCCAICGYSGRLGHRLIALEAAHIKWHCYNGPDIPQNGLALCSIHHKAFDRGIIGLAASDSRATPAPLILISQDLNGSGPIDELFLRHHQRSIRAPQDPQKSPDPAFIAWHTLEVFCGPARV
jgi:putative restriction endonuclease